MGRLRDPGPDLIETIKALEKRVRNLETTAQSGNTSIDSGDFTMNTSSASSFQVFIDGVRCLEIGSGPNLDNVRGVRIWRANGNTAFFTTIGSDHETIGMQDDNSNTILTDDASSGFGLGRPWMAIPFYDEPAFSPSATTSSSSFEALQYAKYNIQQPWVTITAIVVCSDGSTGGEMVLMVNGGEVTPTLTDIPVGTNQIFDTAISFYDFGIEYGSYCDLTVAARVTAGAGNIGIRVIGAYGHQTL